MMARLEVSISRQSIAAVVVALLGFNPVLAETHIVNIHNFVFMPASLNIKAGDSVIWMNRDIVPHTATAKHAGWDSGQIKPGGSHKIDFDSPEQADYFCLYHPDMTGRLDVSR